MVAKVQFDEEIGVERTGEGRRVVGACGSRLSMLRKIYSTGADNIIEWWARVCDGGARPDQE